ncbi:unnamed protein product [Haemonchus placei]|uniref:Tub domain-containing protein n=1 Tax=Haemonchus placei TaxID=6290 RepID=A0A0N4WD60_HAEPC|nr:unnamed protein product [Haemonchus placei]
MDDKRETSTEGQKNNRNGTLVEQKTLSHEKKRSGAEAPPENVPLPQRPFKAAHDSFRLRMFQEQHGFEPVVFMTKKRTRDNKSVMSEFKGGDLNKYTAKTYAIQNGNEVFGGKFNLFSLFSS